MSEGVDRARRPRAHREHTLSAAACCCGHVEEALERRVVDSEDRPGTKKEVGAEKIDIRKMTVRDAHGDFEVVDEDVRRGRHGIDEADRVERVLAKERARRARVDEEKDADGFTTRVPDRERHEDAPVGAVDDPPCREVRVRRRGEREALKPEVVASEVGEFPPR